MSYVELCTQDLLRYFLKKIDPKREGITIDIGLGSHDFYCKFFKLLGWQSIAVEPLPTEEAYQVCQVNNITLIESAIAESDGKVLMYIGNRNGQEDYNLNSLRGDWWGSSTESREVNSMSLTTLLNQINSTEITCLKIDVEGMEYLIIKQMEEIETSLLPKILVFEYGGGGTKESEQGGWSKEIIAETLKCLEILSKLCYKSAIIVDFTPGLKGGMLELNQSIKLNSNIFPPASTYGNIIVVSSDLKDQKLKIKKICKTHQNNEMKTNLFKRFLKRLIYH